MLFSLLKMLKKASNNQLCSLFLTSLKEKIAASSWVAYLLQTPLPRVPSLCGYFTKQFLKKLI
ncbi:MAG: hypothetical protein ACI9JY_002646 [Saprospiraceae bacterium]